MKGKVSFLLFSFFIVFFSLHGDSPAQIHFTATLNAAQAVPAPSVMTTPTGTGTFTLIQLSGREREQRGPFELIFHITFENLSGPPTAAHFHRGAIGVAGPVVRGFTREEISGNTISGVWRSTDSAPLTPALVRALFEGEIYANVHTAGNPGGEIRGQLIPTLGFTATLNTAQAVPTPTVTTVPSGTGTFMLHGARDGLAELDFDITFSNLSGPPTAAHFHNAPAGVAGPVVRGFTEAEIKGNTISGAWRGTDSAALTPALLKALMNGEIYANIHTRGNPAGEIRGQVVLGPGIPMAISFSPATVRRGESFTTTVANGANISLDIMFTFTPPGGRPGPAQVVEGWATLDASGKVTVTVDSSIEPGIYTAIGIRQTGHSTFVPVNASVTVE